MENSDLLKQMTFGGKSLAEIAKKSNENGNRIDFQV